MACPKSDYCIAVGQAPYTGTGLPKEDFVVISHGKAGSPKPLGIEDASSIGCSECFAFGNKLSGTVAQPMVVPIDKGKPGSPEKIKPSIVSATCSTRSCLGSGYTGLAGEGAIFSF